MAHKDKQHIIFDFDGTLGNSFEVIVEALNYYAPRYGYQAVTPVMIPELKGLSARDFLSRIGIKWWMVPFLGWQGRRYVYQRVDRIAPYVGIRELLAALCAAGKQLYIVSSSPTYLLRRFVEQYELEQYFVDIDGGGRLFGKGKLLLRMLSKHRIDQDDIVYVGDEVRDVEACRRLFLPCVSVTWGFNAAEALSGVNDVLVDSPDELEQLFL